MCRGFCLCPEKLRGGAEEMTSRFMEFRRKEIINVANGLKIGYADDLILDTETASIEAVIVYGRPRLFGLLGRGEDLMIPWSEIEVIGEDTVLVKSEGETLPRSGRTSYLSKLFG